jgi:hypothetical protein
MESVTISPSGVIKKSTKKTRSKKPRTEPVGVAVTGLDKIYDSFTTDPDKVRLYINYSPYELYIDPEVILEINTKAHELSAEDFTKYANQLGPYRNPMIKYFQNCVLKTPQVHRILVKLDKGREINPDEACFIASWKRSNILAFKTFSTDEMKRKVGLVKKL